MSWAAVATVGAGLITSGSGGGGGGAAPAAPVTFTPNFGAVSFGDKNLGSDAVASAPTLAGKGWVKVAVWAIAGAVVLAITVAVFRRKKG